MPGSPLPTPSTLLESPEMPAWLRSSCSFRSRSISPLSSMSMAGLKFSRSTLKSSSCSSTLRPAALMTRWTSHPAASSTSSSRTEYVTPLAPVMATTILRFIVTSE